MGRKPAEMVLDVDGDQVTHNQGACQFPVIFVEPDGAGHNRHCAGNALIARTGIAHDWHLHAGHARIGCCRGQPGRKGLHVIGKEYSCAPVRQYSCQPERP